MAAGTIYADRGQWTSVYKGPSLGFFYLTSYNFDPLGIEWRVYYSGFWFYSSGSRTLNSDEQTTIYYGGPSPYADIQVKPQFDALLFAS